MIFSVENAETFAWLDGESLALAISELLRAYRSGNHLVVIDRKSAGWIQEQVELSSRDRAALNRIAQEYTQTGNLRRRATVLVKVTGDRAEHLTVQGREICFSVDRLASCRILERAVLLTENIDADGRFYGYLLREQFSQYQCTNVSYENHHGGGDDLEKVFRHLINDTRIVCAVVDSDRSSPFAAPKAKIGELRKIQAEARWPLSLVLFPPCHEVENLVPMTLVMRLPSGVANSCNSKILSIEEHEIGLGCPIEERFWLFFDIKNGVCPTKIGAMKGRDREWISEKLKLGEVDPSVQVVGGFGDRVISQIFASNQFQSELRRLTRQNSWQSVFSDFIENIVWPLAAGRRLIT